MVSAADVARNERSALCDAFTELGPDAATLCEGWRTRDLAAHLVARESRPDAAIGLLIAPLASHTDTVMRTIAAQPWPKLVQRVRSGPPMWSPMRALDGLANLVEFTVHREDVLRAQSGEHVEDRDEQTMSVLWQRLRSAAGLLFRRDAVVIDCPGFGQWQSRLAASQDSVTLTGTPVDVLLTATGRSIGAHVSGSVDAVTAFNSRRRGI